MTYVHDVLRGSASVEDIDEYWDLWEASEVEHYHDFLGLLWPEYAMWADSRVSEVLEYVIMARRGSLDLRSYLLAYQGENPTVVRLIRMVEDYADAWERMSPHDR